MLLSDYIRRDHILTDMAASDKTGALETLCRFAARLRGLDAQALLDVVMAREKMGSTGIGFGVALPHGATDLLDTPLVALATAKTAVEFDSLDGQPVRLFVLLVTPAGDSGEHLQLLTRLGTMLKSGEAVREFLAAQNPDELFELILKRQ